MVSLHFFCHFRPWAFAYHLKKFPGRNLGDCLISFKLQTSSPRKLKLKLKIGVPVRFPPFWNRLKPLDSLVTSCTSPIIYSAEGSSRSSNVQTRAFVSILHTWGDVEAQKRICTEGRPEKHIKRADLPMAEERTSQRRPGFCYSGTTLEHERDSTRVPNTSSLSHNLHDACVHVSEP